MIELKYFERDVKTNTKRVSAIQYYTIPNFIMLNISTFGLSDDGRIFPPLYHDFTVITL